MGHKNYTDLKFIWVSLLGFGLWFFYWGAHDILARANSEVAGRVLSNDITCPQIENSRCETKYIFESLKDGNQTILVAHAGGITISHLLKPGDIVLKSRGEFQYSVNGNIIEDFPIMQSLSSLIFGLLAICGAFILKKQSQQA